MPSPAREASPADAPEPRRLALALGGGGGKGAAHIGVLQVLEELDITPDLMVGTSAGGAVAVLYAAGLSWEQICQVFRDTSLRRIATPDPTRTGLIGQRKLSAYLTALLGERTFADLRIPCAVVATDLAGGQPVIIREGPLVAALLATTALPSILPPVLRDDMILADGGILNNLPVDVALALGAQKVIAVDLDDALPGFQLAPVEAENPLARLALAPQQLAIANRALALLMARATRHYLEQHPPALLLRPDVADIATLDLSSPEKGQAAGAAAARAAAAELLALRDWRLGPPAEPAPPARPRLPFALPSWGSTGRTPPP
ncbi:patatin-like phospholipase family protein [Oscillochloris sp. ZM17-4]|nr:patatin-like phospholipase family protein [Oscillochloris sp. ZM17-4]